MGMLLSVTGEQQGLDNLARASRRVENAIRGQVRNEQTANRAGDISIQGTAPLTHNGFKVNLMRNLVRRSIRDEPMNEA